MFDWVESEVDTLEQSVGQGARNPEASFDAEPRANSREIGLAQAWLDSLLRADSTNVRAIILYARLGVARVLATPVVFSGSASQEEALPATARDLDRALDRALLKEPGNAEVYFWKGTVCAAPIVRAETPARTRSSLDFDGAVQSLRRSVELAPNNSQYREALAFDLLDLGRIEEARQALGSAGGRHPMYGLLTDWMHVPRPPNSTPSADLRADARRVVARHRLTDWTSARVDAFVVPSRAKEIEAFYRGLFPGFKFQAIDKRGHEGSTVRFLLGLLTLNGDTVAAASVGDQAATPDYPPNSITLFVGEITHPESEVRERYGMPTADVFCTVILANSRKLESVSAEATAITREYAGTYVASPDDDRATLEFMEGRKVRLTVSFAGAKPLTLDGQYSAVGDVISVRFPGGMVFVPGGAPGLLEVRVKGAGLEIMLPRDKSSWRTFELTKQ